MRECDDMLDGEAGLSLIEVMVALVLLGLVMAGTTQAVVGSLQLSASSRAVSVASGLATASMEEALAQGFAANEDEVTVPDAALTRTIDGIEYTVTRSVRWVASSDVTGACVGTAGVADTNVLLVETAVDWPGRTATDLVRQETTVAPPVGLYDPNDGQLAIYVSDAQEPSQPAPGVTVTAVGNGGATVRSATTDANGCVVFGGLDPGNYETSLSRTDYVDIDQRVAPDVTKEVGVVAGTRVTYEFRYARHELIEIALAGRFGGNLPVDDLQLSLANTLGVYPVARGGPAATEVQAWPDAYQAVAGGCAPADPLAEEGGSPVWGAGAARGSYGDTDSPTPGAVVAEMGTVGFTWDPTWLVPPVPSDVTLFAVSDDDCPTAADARIELGPAVVSTPVAYALPWGTWRFEVYDGTTRVGGTASVTTVDPSEAAAPSAQLTRVAACVPQAVRLVGDGNADETVEDTVGPVVLNLQPEALPGDVHFLALYGEEATTRVPSGWTLLRGHVSGAYELAIFTKADDDDSTVTIPGNGGARLRTVAHTYAFANVDVTSIRDVYSEQSGNPASGDDSIVLDDGVTAVHDGSLLLLMAAGDRDGGSTLPAPSVSPFLSAYVNSTFQGSSRFNLSYFYDIVPPGTSPAYTIDWDVGNRVDDQVGVVMVLDPSCPA